MNYKTMQKKTTSLRLVEDRFLTNKFKNKNQHELSIWLNELAPENEWFTGEIAFKGTRIHTEEKKMFAFGVYVNEDYNTINVAELDSESIKNEEELIESTLKGKEIVCVFRVDNLNAKMWEDSDYFQKTIHNALMRYIDRKASGDYRQKILK